jgi:hypothetical protein
MRIFADVEQGSDQWHRIRLGIPTASCFDRIVTPKKCQVSASAYKYALQLVAETLLNEPTASVDASAWMERGRELEPQAVRQYEFTQEVKTLQVGFITTDDGSMGCSPDRLIVDPNKRIALEVKCPSPATHLGYLLDGKPDEYKPQVQGQILIAELDRADFYAFHPRMPPALIQTVRDDEYIDKLCSALGAFNEMKHELLERAKALGVFQAHKQAKSPMEVYEAQAAGGALEADAIHRFGRYWHGA